MLKYPKNVIFLIFQIIYEFECSWELYDENSTLVLSSGPSILTNQYLGDLCFGCTSPIACNYDSNALVNDINDPCIFPSFGYDCNNNCINDSDGDGVCNVFEIVGCQDQTACNYNQKQLIRDPAHIPMEYVKTVLVEL